MKQILVGIDDTSASRAAADGAAAMAQLLGEELVLVAVVEPPRLPAAGPPMGPRPAISYPDANDARDLLGREAKRLSARGVTASTELRYGHAATELAAMAERADVDLVVVPRHAGGALARALHGNVEARLVHTCPKSVLVFPDV